MGNMIKDENPFEIFMPEEERILDKTLKLREQILDKFTEDGIPAKTSEIRVLNEIMNAMDSQVLGRVDRRQKYQENKNNEEAKEIIKELLLRVNNIKKETPVENVVRKEIDRPLDIDELVPGEDVIEYEQITLDEIYKNTQ